MTIRTIAKNQNKEVPTTAYLLSLSYLLNRIDFLFAASFFKCTSKFGLVFLGLRLKLENVENKSEFDLQDLRKIILEYFKEGRFNEVENLFDILEIGCVIKVFGDVLRLIRKKLFKTASVLMSSIDYSYEFGNQDFYKEVFRDCFTILIQQLTFHDAI